MGEKRDKFINEYKVDVLPFMKNKKTRPAQEKEVYKSQNNKLKKVRTKKKTRLKPWAKIALAGLIAFGGYKAYDMYATNQKGNMPITLTQALENGDSLKDLKIDNSIKNELEEIKVDLANKDSSNEDLIALSAKINELQFDTIKTKLSKTLGAEESDITLSTGVQSTSEGTTIETVEVNGGKTYTNKELFKNENTIPSEISDYIKEIGDMQTLMGKLQEGDFNRNDILKEYKEAVKSIDQMAATKITVDKKGNIYVEQTKQKDLKENNKETTKETSRQEIDDEMEL